MSTKQEYQAVLDTIRNRNTKVELPTVKNVEEEKLSQYNNKLLAQISEDKKQITEQELKEQVDKIKPSEEVGSLEDDTFIMDELNNVIRNQHGNRKRRKNIEKRCSKITIADLIIKKYIEQNVPLIPEKLELKYRTVSGLDDEFIKQKISKLQGSKAYIATKYTAYTLAASIISINNNPLIECRENNKLVEEKLEKKYEQIFEYPVDFIADLAVNYLWFSERVKDLSIDNESIINF